MQLSSRQVRHGLLGIIAALLLPVTAAAGDAATVTVLNGTAGDSLIRCSLDDYALEAVPELRGWSKLIVDGEGISSVAGAPELPLIGRGVMIPDHSAVETTVESVKYHDVPNIWIAPSRGTIYRNEDPTQVPYTFGREYRVDAFFPSELVEMERPHVMRDVRGVVVRANPFQYNAVTKTLRVYDEIVYSVKTIGPGSINVIDRSVVSERPDSGFESMYNQHFVNYANNKSRYAPLTETGDMLIISYGSFISTMAPFVTWKNSKGINTAIVDIATIGNNSTSIKNYIKSVYNSSNLAFVLLVGDIAQITSPNYSYGRSDPTYSLMGTDKYPDLLVGRFSGTTAAHIQTQVDRTIDYEQMDHSVSAGGWNAKGMGIASNQGPGHFGEYDDEHMDIIRTQLLGYGFTDVDRIYDPSGTKAQISNGLNAGRRMVNYCGHGSTTSWGTTGFSNTNIDALQNNGTLPFIHSVACVNGEFDAGTCFGEAWLRATHNGEPAGAVGAYMSSINQSWNEPMYAQDESVDLFTAETYWSLGALWYAGSCHMMDVGGSTGQEMFMTWHIFGDPSLTVHATCDAGPPTNYCQGLPNSVGSGATMAYMGSNSISAGDLTLITTGAIPNQFGLFYYGPAQISIPFGEGLRCVGAGGIGVFRLLPPMTANSSGNYSQLLDFNSPPLGGSGLGKVTAGSSWNFQCWYRDPAGGSFGFNYSDGLSVDFCQ
jgi:gingipain R